MLSPVNGNLFVWLLTLTGSCYITNVSKICIKPIIANVLLVLPLDLQFCQGFQHKGLSFSLKVWALCPPPWGRRKSVQPTATSGLRITPPPVAPETRQCLPSGRNAVLEPESKYRLPPIHH